jgi:hypothetical protein
MMENNPHACGVDDIAPLHLTHPCTPAAWIMPLIWVLFQIQFSRWVTSTKPYRIIFA